jgi:hypothetical protein
MEIIMSDLDSLLDGTLDDLADMPEFKALPAGSHRATIKWDMKEVNEQKCPDMGITVIETMELADATATPAAAGDKTNILFMFKKKDGSANEIGQGQFKAIMVSLSETYGKKSPRELMAESEGAEVLITTKVRTDKRDKNDLKHYTDVVSLVVL